MSTLSRAAAKAVSTLFQVEDSCETSTGLAASMAYGQGYFLGQNPTQGPVLEGGASWLIQRYQQTFWSFASSLANQRKTRSTSRYLFPISCDFSTTPQSAVLARRYELEALIFRVTPLVAVAPLSFGIAWTGGTYSELSDTASAGIEIVSRSDVNAGRWTIRRRLADGGALTVIQDTGLDPAAFPGGVHMILRFDSGVVPRLSYILNGVEFGVLSGLAAMPFAVSNNLQVPGVCQGLSVGGGAGQVDRMRQNVFRFSSLS